MPVVRSDREFALSQINLSTSLKSLFDERQFCVIVTTCLIEAKLINFGAINELVFP
jgi:hypothetical protein